MLTNANHQQHNEPAASAQRNSKDKSCFTDQHELLQPSLPLVVVQLGVVEAPRALQQLCPPPALSQPPSPPLRLQRLAHLQCAASAADPRELPPLLSLDHQWHLLEHPHPSQLVQLLMLGHQVLLHQVLRVVVWKVTLVGAAQKLGCPPT
jgi:hypothetical protein